MQQSLVSVARRVFFKLHAPSSTWRFYCSPSPSPSNNKLFVGGLSWSVDEKTLKDAFASYGDVTEVRILYDKETGRSRGFGFVYFSKEDEAKSAKDAMDGKHASDLGKGIADRAAVALRYFGSSLHVRP